MKIPFLTRVLPAVAPSASARIAVHPADPTPAVTRMFLLLLCATLFSVRSAAAQTTIIGDAWISGAMGIGTSTPTARLEVRASSANATAFQVSGVDGTPFLFVSSGGRIGAGLSPSSATLDVNGSADSGAVGLELRSGAMYPSTGTYQIVFTNGGTTNMGHAIRTVHSTWAVNGSMDFYLWRTADPLTSVGSLEAFSLVKLSTTIAFHIQPIGTPDVELEVSNGASTGGGAVHRAAEGTHSSRDLKSDISYLNGQDELKAYEDVQNLKPAVFRYKSWKKGILVGDPKQPLRRGLIYEDTPDSVRGTGESVVIDDRVTNAEMALKELIRRLEAADADASKARERHP